MTVFYFMLSISCEIVGTTFLKLSDGFSRPLPALITISTYICSFYTLSLVLKKVDVGITYAIWSALGTAILAAIGILWFKEPISFLKISSLLLVISGVVGLQLSSVTH